MVLKITTKDKEQEVKKYIDQTNKKTEVQRKQEQEPNGVFTGAYAINPVNKKKIPI
jgi:leucyl-tRNA synthetase